MLEIFNISFDITVVIRIVLAVVLGGVVGLEREFAGREAGLRTHILVCVGATLVMVTSESLPFLIPNMQDCIKIDPGRIVAGIVTGIGFLGAGAVIRTTHMTRGLTTAACIWFVAVLGTVIGARQYSLAIISTVVILIGLRLFGRIEKLIPHTAFRMIVVSVLTASVDELLSNIDTIFSQYNIRVRDSGINLKNEGGLMEITFYIRVRGTKYAAEVVRSIGVQNGVKSVEWR